MKRRNFLETIGTVALGAGLVSCNSYFKKDLDITFIVGADTHFDPPPETDQYFHIRAMNGLIGKSWPGEISGNPAPLASAGTIISDIKAVVLTGDLLDKADSSALDLFRSRYEKGPGDKQIHFPVYIGLGNHDLNPVLEEPARTIGRKRMISYLESRHQGPKAPVVADNFDPDTHSYSWNWGNLHLIQCQLFGGATLDNQAGSIQWLANDLQTNAGFNKPVILFQHYGFDPWALKWWTEEARTRLLKLLKPYNILGIFAGHSHVAMNMIYDGFDIFQVNNAWPDDDGKGSFALVRVTDTFMDMVTCRVLNGDGGVEWTGPFMSKRY